VQACRHFFKLELTHAIGNNAGPPVSKAPPATLIRERRQLFPRVGCGESFKEIIPDLLAVQDSRKCHQSITFRALPPCDRDGGDRGSAVAEP
jgi:hypothetical protein